MELARRCVWLVLFMLLLGVATSHLVTASVDNLRAQPEGSTKLAEREYEGTQGQDVHVVEEGTDYSSVTQPVSYRSRRSRSASPVKRKTLATQLVLVGVAAAFIAAGYVAMRYHLTKKSEMAETKTYPLPDVAVETADMPEKSTVSSLLENGRRILPVGAALAMAAIVAYQVLHGSEPIAPTPVGGGGSAVKFGD